MDKILVKTPFGEIAKDDNGKFRMTDKQYYEQLEKRGLVNAKEVLKAVNDAKSKLMLDVYDFLGDEVIRTKEDQFMSVGTGEGSGDYARYATKTMNIPGEKGQEPQQKTYYGYCTYHEKHRIPEAFREVDGPLYKKSLEIEEALRATIKVA